MDPIDIDTDTPFHPSAWIGVGKEFSNLLPPEVLNEKEKILKIPETFDNPLPPPTTPVLDFIRHDLPFQSGALNFHFTTEWFSNDDPDTDPATLLTRSVPPRSVLKDLDAAVGQVWLDGGRSLVDPRFNNGTERFPFWVLSLWNKAQESIRCQNEWRKSVRWLNSITCPGDIISRAKGVVGRLSWNEPLCLRGATSLDLTGFLGTRWLSDTQINMMIESLHKRMEAEEHTGGTIIESVVFSQEITLVARRLKEPTSKYLSRLAGRIRETQVKTLWFPIHVNNSHWIAGRVDFERCAFAFGKQFANMVNKTIKTYLPQAIQWSLGRMFPLPGKC